MTERGSSKHGARLDEQMAAETRDLLAPDDVLDRLATLPPGTTYQTVSEIWSVSTAG
jgi:hypothetical protein